MLTLYHKAKRIIILWGLQVLLGMTVLVMAFAVLPALVANQVQLSRELELQKLAERLIAHSRSLAEESSTDMLVILDDALREQSLVFPHVLLSVDLPARGQPVSPNRPKHICGHLSFTDLDNNQHALYYYQPTELTPTLGHHVRLLQIGIVSFLVAVFGLPWILPGWKRALQALNTDSLGRDGSGPPQHQTSFKNDSDGLPCGVVVLDASSSVEYANAQAAGMLKLPPELLIGMPAKVLEDVLGIPGAGGQIMRVLESGLTRGFLVELLHQDHPQQVFVSISRMGTNPPKTLLLLQDRSDYKRLSARTNLLQQVIDGVPSAVIAIDRRSRVIALNDYASLVLDMEKTKCLGRTLPGSLAQLLPSLANHEEVAGLTLRIGDSAEGVEYDIRTRRLHDFHGREQGTMCILNDITARRTLTEQLKRNERLAVIGQMAAGTVHEIRNPLAAIRGLAQLMAQTPDKAKTQEYSEMIMVEIDRIDQIFSEYLLLSHAVEPEMNPVELSDVIRDALQLLQALFEQKHIRMHIDKWQPGQILGDPHYLQHVFLHLLHNALDATPAGGSISLGLVRLGEVALITITDTGSGMGDDVLSNCFDPFFTTKETGTGLGLTICQRLLDQMNGFIKIESQPGVGTTVCLTFPLSTVTKDE